jgi:branched-chain amino acid transport system substrate-binding protein
MKRYSRLVISFGIICVVVASFPFVTSAQDSEVIRLGAMYALTGKGSSLGVKQMDAAKLAINEINARGGANFGGKRVKIEPVYEDSETTPKVAARKMEAMVVDKKITALVGGTFAHVAIAMNGQAKKTPVLFCSSCSMPEKIFTPPEKGPYTISTMIPAESVGAGAASYVAERMKLKNVVVCLPDYAWGHAMSRGIERVFKKIPGVTYSTVWTPLGAEDMKPYLTEALEAKPQIIMMGQWGNDGIRILKQAHEMRVKEKTKIFYNWIVNVYATDIPPEALQGVTCQMFWYHSMAGLGIKSIAKAVNDFTARYRKAYGEPPDPYAASAYMGVHEIIRGMELAKSSDPAKAYRALMAHPKWNGPKGPGTWMKDGLTRYKFSAFIGVGLGANSRKDKKYDYARVITLYASKWFMKTPEELGW